MKLISEIIWWGAVLTGCSQNITLDMLPSENLKVKIHNNVGMSITECVFTPEDHHFKNFSKLFEENTKNWIATSVTYVPNIEVIGINFQVNFINNHVVINSKNGQYIHEIKLEDYKFIKCE